MTLAIVAALAASISSVAQVKPQEIWDRSANCPVCAASIISRSMKLRKLDSLRYAFCDLDFFWSRGSEARVTFARGLLMGVTQLGLDAFISNDARLRRRR